jgi:small multidrug resistance pump
MFWFYFSFVYLFDILGVTAAKWYSLHGTPWYLVLCMASFAMTGLFFSLAVKESNQMAIANILWVSVAALLITAIGYFFFKEDLSTMQLAGVGVIFLGLLLINN